MDFVPSTANFGAMSKEAGYTGTISSCCNTLRDFSMM
jgi:hypothetical protein